MIRGRPFFAGNYGGPLVIDTAAQLIAQSGKTQAICLPILARQSHHPLMTFAPKEKREKEKAAKNQFPRMYDQAKDNRFCCVWNPEPR